MARLAAPGQFLVTGGHPGDRLAVRYDVGDGTSVRMADMAHPRNMHGCSLVRNETFVGVLVAGGDGPDNYPVDSSELLDLATGAWREVGPLAVARDTVKIVVLKERILAVGGAGPGVEEFSLATLTWSVTDNLVTDRQYHAVAELPENMFNCQGR